MSIKLLTDDKRKDWLNPRINDLKLDGILIPSTTNGTLYSMRNTLNLFVGGGSYIDIQAQTIDSNDYKTTLYECNCVFQVSFNSIPTTSVKVRFVVRNMNTNVNIYTGNPITIDGTNLTQKCLYLLDTFEVNKSITTNFKLILQLESTSLIAGQSPLIRGNTLFKSVSQSLH
jgi:hypothetical protein